MSLREAGIGVIAISDFTDLKGKVTELGRFLAEELSVALAEFATGFKVVDRTHLKALLEQHELNASGLIDPQTARLIGQFAGVDALVTGTITPFGNRVRVNIKVLELDTAIIVTSAVIDVRDTSLIRAVRHPASSELGNDAGEEDEPGAPTDVPLTGDQPEYDLLLSCHLRQDTAQCTLNVSEIGTDRSYLIDCRAALPHSPKDREH